MCLVWRPMLGRHGAVGEWNLLCWAKAVTYTGIAVPKPAVLSCPDEFACDCLIGNRLCKIGAQD